MPDFLFGCEGCGYNVTVQTTLAAAPVVLCDSCDRLMACRGQQPQPIVGGEQP